MLRVWYDAKAEVHPETSWTSLSKYCRSAPLKSLNSCTFTKVLALNSLDRHDVIIADDNEPILTIEQTNTVPSGHNLPQRFAKLIRSAEMGVPSIFYFQEFSRHSYSDKTLRFLNPRVLLAQFRMEILFDTTCLAAIWPTDPRTSSYRTDSMAHAELAKLVDAIIKAHQTGQALKDVALVQKCRNNMIRMINHYGAQYTRSNEWQEFFPSGYLWARDYTARPIDPPDSCRLVDTKPYLEKMWGKIEGRMRRNRKTEFLLSRPKSVVFAATTTKSGTGPEHPYPGHLAMLDILYARRGPTIGERFFNLICELPMHLEQYKTSTLDNTTGLRILNEICDLVVLDDAIVASGIVRTVSAGAVLAQLSDAS
jgi:hypothetical protein